MSIETRIANSSAMDYLCIPQARATPDHLLFSSSKQHPRNKLENQTRPKRKVMRSPLLIMTTTCTRGLRKAKARLKQDCNDPTLRLRHDYQILEGFLLIEHSYDYPIDLAYTPGMTFYLGAPC